MKVIFLDIDGVLNSRRTKPADPKGIRDWIDPENVLPLRRALEVTRAGLVLTSSWRLSTSLEEIRDVFDSLSIRPAFLDVTPSRGAGLRHDEIRAWLATRSDVEDWVVLDDEFLEGLKDRQVRTSTLDGLTERHADQVIARLSSRVG